MWCRNFCWTQLLLVLVLVLVLLCFFSFLLGCEAHVSNSRMVGVYGDDGRTKNLCRNVDAAPVQPMIHDIRN